MNKKLYETVLPLLKEMTDEEFITILRMYYINRFNIKYKIEQEELEAFISTFTIIN